LRNPISGGIFDYENGKNKLIALEEKTTQPGFWNDNKTASIVNRKISRIKENIDLYDKIYKDVEDVYASLQLLEEYDDLELKTFCETKISELKTLFENIEIETLFSNELSENNAIINIHPGAGGTESQDWAQMLYRMYLYWFEKMKFEHELLDYQLGEEAGIKNVTLLVKGKFAYGYLSTEQGIHRLVRISPFDSNARRHTSFAAVSVMPEINDDIKIEINEEDLRIDTYRASGAGGQHINKTDSAVRITHIPTGLVSQCQTERSQHKNKESAMLILKSKLYAALEEEKKKEINKIAGDKSDIAWGRQIRSYVFQPYTMVKDHRTDVEIGNIQSVMDGNIDPFIKSFLKKQAAKKNEN